MIIQKTPLLYNYDNNKRAIKPFQINNIHPADTVKFTSRVKYLTDIGDGIDVSDGDKLKKMLELYNTTPLKKFPELSSSVPFIKQGAKKCLRAVNSWLGDKKQEIQTPSQTLADAYTADGIYSFVNRNKELFGRLMEQGQGREYEKFQKDVKRNSPVKIPSYESLGLKYDKQLMEDYKIAGADNGALAFIAEHVEFLKAKSETLAKTKSFPVSENPRTREIAGGGSELSAKSINPPLTEPSVFDGQKVLAEYRQIRAEQKKVEELKTEEEKALWNTQDEKIRGLFRQIIENNISLVEKKEFDLDPTKQIEEKRAYLDSISGASVNQASKLDYLEMFEKYGERRWTNEDQGKSTLRNLSQMIGDKNNSDKVLIKYINIMDNLAKSDNTGMRDAISISWVFEKNVQIMSKDTLLKFIKVLKKTSFQQRDAHCAELDVKKTPFKDDAEVKEALKDYKKSLEQFPYEDRTYND